MFKKQNIALAILLFISTASGYAGCYEVFEATSAAERARVTEVGSPTSALYDSSLELSFDRLRPDFDYWAEGIVAKRKVMEDLGRAPKVILDGLPTLKKVWFVSRPYAYNAKDALLEVQKSLESLYPPEIPDMPTGRWRNKEIYRVKAFAREHLYLFFTTTSTPQERWDLAKAIYPIDSELATEVALWQIFRSKDQDILSKLADMSIPNIPDGYHLYLGSEFDSLFGRLYRHLPELGQSPRGWLTRLLGEGGINSRIRAGKGLQLSFIESYFDRELMGPVEAGLQAKSLTPEQKEQFSLAIQLSYHSETVFQKLLSMLERHETRMDDPDVKAVLRDDDRLVRTYHQQAHIRARNSGK